MADSPPFFVDRAKGGRASCKGCKSNCPGGELRIAKLVASPYGEGHMKSWYHVDCFMNVLLKQRPATKRVDSIDDIAGWGCISAEDQEFILKKLNEMEKLYAEKNSGKYTAKIIKNISTASVEASPSKTASNESKDCPKKQVETDDDKFVTFFTLCKRISKVDAYTEKTAVVNNFFRKGSDDDSFKGDLTLWCKLLLPQVSKRVYNLKSKQLVKLFSRIFNMDHDDMLTHLEQGDVADTIQSFFKKSKTVQPASESTLTIQKVEDFLEDLSKLTKEEEQIYHFKKIVKKCTANELKMLIRLIKGDLRINAGPKHILEGVHPDAYSVFQTSRDLNMVLDRILSETSTVKHKDAIQKGFDARLSLMTPVLPMLAEACKSVEMAMKKCPNGMFSEIKYDGERVQVHKKGNEFKYFSRALKPVMAHKVSHFKDYLPQAFPKGTDLILDAEVLMVDVNTGKPLPFGTLGIHKQSEFKDAQVCLFVFDCLYYNGKVLIDLPIRKRRKILHENMVEVTNHVMLSEQKLIEKPSDLAKMIAEVLELGLEGLVLKDLESTYEPGKRHWLKVKKDYLFDGAMADSADLVVLGAWFGTGKKGGMMSVFLMGCHDARRKKWVTVTKVHTGHDDSTLERLQKELAPLMVKISQDSNKVPSWLDCNKGMVPDFVALDPKKQPVWEITGTELTKANLHTADGISVRFPRVTRIRTDKDWETATNLEALKLLYKTSKEKTDVSLLNKLAATANDEPPLKKIKASPSKTSTTTKPTKVSPKNKIDSFIIKKEKKSEVKLNLSNSSEKANSSTATDVDMKEESNTSDEEIDSTKPIKVSPKNKIDSFIIKKEKQSEVKLNQSNSSEKANTSAATDVDMKEEGNVSDEEIDSKELEFNPDVVLPDVFEDKRLGFYPDFISFTEDEREHFERHWIAYGGTVVKSIRSMDVDYVLHNSNTIEFKKMLKLKKKVPADVRHVHKDWLMQCINDVKLCDTKFYPVFIVT
ncbi:DNA ligase 3 [Helicoverpa zea]|uniref:DNA ligase 3 n=1 Tax=Helicoverpa zea TaxID=7113 RepID=UPI001F59E020|nr:DNA ligase 3 [Helicoverpa zea]